MQAWVVGALNFSREVRNAHCYVKSTSFYRQNKHLCSAGSESHLPSSRPEPLSLLRLNLHSQLRRLSSSPRGQILPHGRSAFIRV